MTHSQQTKLTEMTIPSLQSVPISLPIAQKSFHKRGLSCDPSKLDEGNISSRLLISLISDVFYLTGTVTYANGSFDYDYRSMFEIFDAIKKSDRIVSKIQFEKEWLEDEVKLYIDIITEFRDNYVNSGNGTEGTGASNHGDILESVNNLIASYHNSESFDIRSLNLAMRLVSKNNRKHFQHSDDFETLIVIEKALTEGINGETGKQRYDRFVNYRLGLVAIENGDVYVSHVMDDDTNKGIVVYSGNYQLHIKERFVQREMNTLLDRLYRASDAEYTLAMKRYEHFMSFTWHRGTIININFKTKTVDVRCESVSWHPRYGVDDTPLQDGTSKLKKVLDVETRDPHTVAKLMLLDEVIIMRAWTEWINDEPTLRFSVSHGAFVGRMIYHTLADGTKLCKFIDTNSRWPDIKLRTDDGTEYDTQTFMQIFIELCETRSEVPYREPLIYRYGDTEYFNVEDNQLVTLMDSIDGGIRRCHTFVMYHRQSQIINNQIIDYNSQAYNFHPYIRFVNEYAQFDRPVNIITNGIELSVQHMKRIGDAVSVLIPRGVRASLFSQTGEDPRIVKAANSGATSYIREGLTVFNDTINTMIYHSAKYMPYGILVSHAANGAFIPGTEVTYTSLNTLKFRMISSDRPDKAARYFGLTCGDTILKGAEGIQFIQDRTSNRNVFINYLIPDYLRSTVLHRINMIERFIQRSDAAVDNAAIKDEKVDISLPSKLDFYSHIARVLRLMFADGNNILASKVRKNISDLSEYDACANMINCIYETITSNKKTEGTVVESLKSGTTQAAAIFKQYTEHIILDLPSTYNRFAHIYSDNEAALYVYYVINDYLKSVVNTEKHSGWLRPYIATSDDSDSITDNSDKSDTDTASESSPRQAPNNESIYISNIKRTEKKFYEALSTHLKSYIHKLELVEQRTSTKGKRIVRAPRPHRHQTVHNRTSNNNNNSNVVIKYAETTTDKSKDKKKGKAPVISNNNSTVNDVQYKQHIAIRDKATFRRGHNAKDEYDKRAIANLTKEEVDVETTQITSWADHVDEYNAYRV